MLSIKINSKQLRKAYIDFIYSLYENDSNFVDTSLFIVNTFLDKSDSFIKECGVEPMAIVDDDKILAQCMYIYHKDLPYFQIGFFEALPNQEKAVDMLLTEAAIQAKNLGLYKMVIGLNGHVSYGVGILIDSFDKKISFDSLYNKSYYKDYFEKYKFEKQSLSTYYFDMCNIPDKLKCIDKIYKRISFRTMDMKRFKDEMILFGTLCNTCLHDTYLYFNRDPLCLYELINDMKPFLKPENLIFAMKDEKEIGFVFWHPDYNEILRGGKRNSMLKIGIDYYLNKNKIKTLKVNAIGVIPKYQKTGTAMGLINEVYKYSRKQFLYGETNFVWDNNTRSRLLNLAINDRDDRHYCVYIKEIQ